MPVEQLEDLGDPRLEDYKHLREPSRRMGLERDRGIFTVEGRLSVQVLLESSYRVRSVLVSSNHLERLRPLVPPEVLLLTLPAREIESVSGVHFHRGVLAVAERPAPTPVGDLTGNASRVLVLEAVSDHENIGSLFRNAAAFGVDAVLLDPRCADPLYRRSTRVSLGHVLRVPFTRVDEQEWPHVLGDLSGAGILTVALTPAGDTLLGDLVGEAPERWALVVGAEGPGLTDAALASAARRVRIPIAAGVDSVNVATAAAIALSALHGWR